MKLPITKKKSRSYRLARATIANIIIIISSVTVSSAHSTTTTCCCCCCYRSQRPPSSRRLRVPVESLLLPGVLKYFAPSGLYLPRCARQYDKGNAPPLRFCSGRWDIATVGQKKKGSFKGV